MSSVLITFQEVKRNFCVFVDTCCRFNCFTRSMDEQKNKAEECNAFIAQIKHYKAQAINANDEFSANQFFHMQCVLNALHSIFNMWCSIKENKFQQAWNQLIDAQEYVVVALRIEEYEDLIKFQKKLLSIEEAIFPGWALFNSPGVKETIGKCSICGENFALCEHIENEIYMGALCQRVEREIIGCDHTAFVEKPRDRRCIVTEISDDDGCMIDYFTWEKTGEKVEISAGSVAIVRVVMLHCNGLDLL